MQQSNIKTATPKATLKKTINFRTCIFDIFEYKGMEYVKLKDMCHLLNLDFNSESIEVLNDFGTKFYGTVKADVDNTLSETLIRFDRVEYFIARNGDKGKPRPLTEKSVDEFISLYNQWNVFVLQENLREKTNNVILAMGYEKAGIQRNSKTKGGAK